MKGIPRDSRSYTGPSSTYSPALLTTPPRRVMGYLVALSLAGCGSTHPERRQDEQDPPPPLPNPPQRVHAVCFKAPTVQNLGFRAGQRQGVTNSNGCFEVEVDQPITFFVGNVVLGTADTDSDVITVLDLSSEPQVQDNLVRFLLLLNEDFFDTQVQLSAAVRARAAQWPQLDFAAADLSTEFALLQADAISADGGRHALPTAAAARVLFNERVLCTFTGIFDGGINGELADSQPYGVTDIRGSLGLLVPFQAPIIGNSAYFTMQNYSSAFAPIASAAPLALPDLDFESSGINIIFSGHFNTRDEVRGTWSARTVASTKPGTFGATRAVSSATALFRFTGQAHDSADNPLFVEFDLSADDKVLAIITGGYGSVQDTIHGSYDHTTGILQMQPGKYYLLGAQLSSWLAVSGNIVGPATAMSFELSGCVQ